ncbi:toll/interleukin-1 receptor domain-containing protein [Pseudomonas yamanorum]|uniref:toll/interleukin-1 receptor domain-containing protein n=1 Tax=Pseudomonas yamanorum TaxID=515393 RepID=UPI0015A00862|nr:toll/interleukin-1 receptor domain-containing protein [Pseudomonas yamanorum]NWD22621.1 toll/interleukin-1 receptor domain-containing protein [Pseudomonas yamanorum]
MTKSAYQIIAMGDLGHRLNLLKCAVHARAKDLGIREETIIFLTSATFPSYDRKKPAIGVYFGHKEKTSPTFLDELIQDSIVIAPIASAADLIEDEIPEQLKHINVLVLPADDSKLTRLVSLIFETFRLLRKDRGIFISYRRKGSQPLANRIYENLDKRGFDVFIDVRSVPPAVDFQAELWHRMSDVDVIVLIDTPGFREGRWTKAELAQANLLGIQTLHLLWPGQIEDNLYAFSRYMKLEPADFSGSTPGRGARIKKSTMERICDRAEDLRAEAMALRHAHLVDNFCDAARDLKLVPTVQPQRWISLETQGKNLAVVPAVGRPTSDRINAIFDSISEQKQSSESIWVIYDSRGLHDNWVKHLRWLDSHLPIRTVSMADAPAALKECLS